MKACGEEVLYGGSGFPVEVGDYSAVRDRNLHIEKRHRSVIKIKIGREFNGFMLIIEESQKVIQFLDSATPKEENIVNVTAIKLFIDELCKVRTTTEDIFLEPPHEDAGVRWGTPRAHRGAEELTKKLRIKFEHIQR